MITGLIKKTKIFNTSEPLKTQSIPKNPDNSSISNSARTGNRRFLANARLVKHSKIVAIRNLKKLKTIN
jgi:hypothetical protein